MVSDIFTPSLKLKTTGRSRAYVPAYLSVLFSIVGYCSAENSIVQELGTSTAVQSSKPPFNSWSGIGVESTVLPSGKPRAE